MSSESSSESSVLNIVQTVCVQVILSILSVLHRKLAGQIYKEMDVRYPRFLTLVASVVLYDDTIRTSVTTT
jgi:hypothetical protein